MWVNGMEKIRKRKMQSMPVSRAAWLEHACGRKIVIYKHVKPTISTIRKKIVQPQKND